MFLLSFYLYNLILQYLLIYYVLYYRLCYCRNFDYYRIWLLLFFLLLYMDWFDWLIISLLLYLWNFLHFVIFIIWRGDLDYKLSIFGNFSLFILIFTSSGILFLNSLMNACSFTIFFHKCSFISFVPYRYLFAQIFMVLNLVRFYSMLSLLCVSL